MKTKILGIVFIVIGLVIIPHHIIISGRPFDIKDMLHHEFFEAILLTAGMIILITAQGK